MRILVALLTLASVAFLLLSVYYYTEVARVMANWDSSPQGFTNSLNQLAKSFTAFAVSITAFVIFFLCLLALLLTLWQVKGMM
jgi:hypothetical protein